MAQVKIKVLGPFVLEIDGNSVTPRLAKSQAIIAVMALREQKTVSRKWLQALLWPDRAEAQASGSLRACLKEIRKIFVDAADCLSIGRQNITLFEDKVEIDISSASSVRGREILEGFEVPYSDAFEDWLRDTRSRYAFSSRDEVRGSQKLFAVPAHINRNLTKLFVINPVGGPDVHRHLQLVSILDSAVSFVSERMSTCVQYIDSAHDLNEENGLILEARLALYDRRNILHFRLRDFETETLVWAKTFQIDSDAGPQSDDYRLIVNFVADTIELQLMQRADLRGAETFEQFLRRGIHRISTLDKLTWHEADGWLKQSYDLTPNAISLAWRSYLRTLMHAERQDKDREDVITEGIEFAKIAMEYAPNNSMVLGLSAHTMSILAQSHDVALELSDRALLINPSNTFALATKGIAQSHLGDVQAGYETAAQAQRIGCFSNLKPFLDLSAAITATMCHEFEAALTYSRICNVTAPRLGAPLRYLTALSFHLGDEAGGYASARRLSELESGFSFEWLKNADYPSAGIRKAGITAKLPGRHI